MNLKHIARVNGSNITCTQYDLNPDDYTLITKDPTRLLLVYAFQSLTDTLHCYHCLKQCKQCLSKRMTKLISFDECDTYVRDDIYLYCSMHCLMCDSQGVVDDQSHITLGNSICE